MQKRSHRGFTLIELVIVITILAILAAVAIPAFQNLTNQARNAGVQGAVGGLRSAVAVYRANRIANGLSEVYPSVDNFNSTTGAGHPMENAIVPDNPWCRTANPGPPGCDPNLVVDNEGVTDTRPIISSSAAGWAYNSTTGLIYANSAANGGGAGARENEF